MSKKLTYYGGDGYTGCKENGSYEVEATACTEFTKLSEARKFYNSLNVEKSLWKTGHGSELLECHMLADPDEPHPNKEPVFPFKNKNTF